MLDLFQEDMVHSDLFIELRATIIKCNRSSAQCFEDVQSNALSWTTEP